MRLPAMAVGNDIVVPRPQLQVAAPVVVGPSPSPAEPVLGGVDFDYEKTPHSSHVSRIIDFLHNHSIAVFAVLFLMVASSAIYVGQAYWTAHNLLRPTKQSLHIPAQPVQGPNMAIATQYKDEALQHIASQSIALSIGSKKLNVSSDTIKSWVQAASDNQSGVTYLHVNNDLIAKSLNDVAAPYIKAPVSEVVASNADGSKHVLAAGKNGTQLGDVANISHQISQELLSAKGMQFNLPITTLAYSTVAPSDFDKLIEVNVTSKQMWLYEKGQLYKQYPISAGKASTPTPIGQFKIYEKLAVQDMRGYNPNGTQYFQPHVHWINYFLPGGYAIHGVYWHGSSWFGNINSSHGCVGLPDTQAKEVYDWAPIGTTIITHF